jgi:hypothetical protein
MSNEQVTMNNGRRAMSNKHSKVKLGGLYVD